MQTESIYSMCPVTYISYITFQVEFVFTITTTALLKLTFEVLVMEGLILWGSLSPCNYCFLRGRRGHLPACEKHHQRHLSCHLTGVRARRVRCPPVLRQQQGRGDTLGSVWDVYCIRLSKNTAVDRLIYRSTETSSSKNERQPRLNQSVFAVLSSGL